MALPGVEQSEKQKHPLRWMQWIPLAILATPFLFLLLLAGPAIQSTLMGPVNIWNSTRSVPPDNDLAGYYQLHPKDRESLLRRSVFVSDRSGFRLSSDHSLEVIDLPSFDGFGNGANCRYNGRGHWSIDSSGMDTNLILDIGTSLPAAKGDLPSCGTVSLGLFVVLGHSAPYRFGYWIEDPDQWNGLTYVRR